MECADGLVMSHIRWAGLVWALVCLFVVGVSSTAVGQTWVNAVTISPATNKATIRWTTAVPADSQIKYGTTASYGRRNTLDPALVTSHAMTLSSLQPGTVYHFRILTSDATGSLVTSMNYSFVTASGPVAVTVTPATATVASGGTQQFSASVSNCGDNSVTWAATGGTISSSGLFTAPAVTADQTVTVTATSVTDSTKSASAVVTVKAPAPAIGLSPASLAFSGQAGGGNPSPQNVSITNTGGGTLTFTVATDAAWLSATPASGTAPRTVQVSASTAGLVAGTYAGHVTVTASGATGSPATVTVLLTVTAPPPPQHSVDLSWNASTSPGVVGYNAYRSTTHGGPYELVGSAITDLAYTDRTVVAGQTYYYVVTATDEGTQESAYSAEVTAAVPSP